MSPPLFDRAPFLLLLLCAAAVSASSSVPAGGNASTSLLAHNIHVTHARMVVENGVAVTRIRFFRHDLDAALAAFHKRENFSIDNTQESDSLFLDYMSARFSLETESAPLKPVIVSSGGESELWWYELQFSQDAPITSLSLRNELLFEIYPDQKHFLKVLFFPSGISRSLYFVDGSSKYEISDK